MNNQRFWNFIKKCKGNPSNLVEVVPPEEAQDFVELFREKVDALGGEIDASQRFEDGCFAIIMEGPKEYEHAMKLLKQEFDEELVSLVEEFEDGGDTMAVLTTLEEGEEEEEEVESKWRPNEEQTKEGLKLQNLLKKSVSAWNRWYKKWYKNEKSTKGYMIQRLKLLSLDAPGYDLHGIFLENAFLPGSNLAGANLAGANLTFAQMNKSNLQKANLQDARIVVADLDRSNFQGARLQRAEMRNSFMKRVNFQNANLQGANLEGAELKGANLAGANLQGAKLFDAELKGANLQGANLKGADLEHAGLQKTNLQLASVKGAKYNEYTSFPSGFNPKESKMIFVKRKS